MNITHADDFTKSLRKLPARIRRQYLLQEQRFTGNHRDSRLHLKKLQGLEGVYSFRITREYRALFYFHDRNSVTFFAIGHRKDIYR